MSLLLGVSGFVGCKRIGTRHLDARILPLVSRNVYEVVLTFVGCGTYGKEPPVQLSRQTAGTEPLSAENAIPAVPLERLESVAIMI